MIKIKISYEHKDEYKDIKNLISFLGGAFPGCIIKHANSKYQEMYIEIKTKNTP